MRGYSNQERQERRVKRGILIGGLVAVSAYGLTMTSVYNGMKEKAKSEQDMIQKAHSISDSSKVTTVTPVGDTLTNFKRDTATIALPSNEKIVKWGAQYAPKPEFKPYFFN